MWKGSLLLAASSYHSRMGGKIVGNSYARFLFATPLKIVIAQKEYWLPLSRKFGPLPVCHLTKLTPNFWERGSGGEGSTMLKILLPVQVYSA